MASSSPAASVAGSATDQSITLSGSARLVTEFFSYSVNTLLHLREVYPPEKFSRVAKYGLTMPVSTDDGVKNYLDSVLRQMHDLLTRRALQRVIVVIASIVSGKALERWAFDVNLVQEGVEGQNPMNQLGEQPKAVKVKAEKQIMGEIQALVRQITASATFLPLLNEKCSFDVLIYVKKEAHTTPAWEETDPKVIPDKERVQLRSFSTSVHNVEACVSYPRGF